MNRPFRKGPRNAAPLARANGPLIAGELRPSQLLYTFGVGNIVDLPYLATIVLGTDDWSESPTVIEDRLLARVQEQLGAQVDSLRLPPSASDSTNADPTSCGVRVSSFPRFLRCTSCNLLASIASGSFALESRGSRADRLRYRHVHCSKGKFAYAVPARFLVACERGHLDDFPWHDFVHRGVYDGHRGQLRLEESGVSGEARDVFVRCDTCGSLRSMAEAFDKQESAFRPKCTGRRPHLRGASSEECSNGNARTILLGASNSWFPVLASALSIPRSQSDALSQRVEGAWVEQGFAEVTDVATLTFLRKRGLLSGFADLTDAELFAAIEKRRARGDDEANNTRDLKRPEYNAFAAISTPSPTSDFELRDVALNEPWRRRRHIARVVQVRRLREVTALLGFTRIVSPREFADGDKKGRELWAPIARTAPTWVPATEVRGEGVFVQFDEEWVSQWEQAAIDDCAPLFEAHKAWRRQRALEPDDLGFVGARAVALHSFSHALMRQFSLECGYGAASLRERIYATDGGDGAPPMAGVLIYTAAPDSEGTLGGLVRLAEPAELERHVEAALRALRLCSSDPLCAEYFPVLSQPVLHGAACHACLFAPETSCELGNRYLDRRLLVPTVRGASGREFFFEEA